MPVGLHETIINNKAVIPVETGIQCITDILDSCFRRNDRKRKSFIGLTFIG